MEREGQVSRPFHILKTHFIAGKSQWSAFVLELIIQTAVTLPLPCTLFSTHLNCCFPKA